MKEKSSNNTIKMSCLGIIVVLYSFVKIHFGIHSDEIHSIAVGDMISRGSDMFKDCWFYLQLSSVISSPFEWVYYQITGSNQGIILFFRYMAVIVQAAISLLFYNTFKVNRNSFSVYIAAVCYFCFIPDFLSFGYKPELIWFTMLEIVFLYRYLVNHLKRELIVLGIVSSLCVLAFPTTVFQALSVFLFLLWSEKENNNAVIIFSLTCFFCAICFLAYVLSRISLREFLQFFPEILKDDQLASSFLIKLVHPCAKILAIGIVGLSPLLGMKMLGKKINILGRIPIMTVMFVAAFLVQCFVERRGITWHCITYPLSLTLFYLPYLCIKSDEEERKVGQCFSVIAWSTFFCIALASNQGNITSLYAGIFSACGLLVLLGEKSDFEYLFDERKPIAICLVIMSFLMFVFPVWDQEAIDTERYGMRTIFSDRELIEKGPAQGIYVGADMYNRYNELCDVIDDYVKDTDKVYIIESAYYCSFGYLHQKGEYATYSPRGHYFDRIVDYWKVNPDKTPTKIIISKKYLEERDDIDFPRDTLLEGFLNQHGYTEVDEQNFKVFVK